MTAFEVSKQTFFTFSFLKSNRGPPLFKEAKEFAD